MNDLSITCSNCGNITKVNAKNLCYNCGYDLQKVNFNANTQHINAAQDFPENYNTTNQKSFLIDRPYPLFVRSSIFNAKHELTYKVEANGNRSFFILSGVSILVFLVVVAIVQRLFSPIITGIIGTVGMISLFLGIPLLSKTLFRAQILADNNAPIASIKQNIRFQHMLGNYLSRNWVTSSLIDGNCSYIDFQSRNNGIFKAGNKNYKIEIKTSQKRKVYFKYIKEINAFEEESGYSIKFIYYFPKKQYIPTKFQIVSSKEIDNLTIVSFAIVIIAKFFTLSKFERTPGIYEN